MKITLRSLLLISVFQLFSFSAFPQGSLTPPGTPAPTFKTLQQVEPRIDLQATSVPIGVDTSNAAYHFIITQAGSYYLSANLGVTKTNGIQITVEGVTLDLNGFEISRASGTGGTGVEIGSSAHRAVLRNGSVKGFLTGINGPGSRACVFRDIVISGCTGRGLFAGNGAVLDGCRAENNTGIDAMLSGAGCSWSNCTAFSNTVNNSVISTGGGSSLTNCLVHSNTAVFGIFAGGHSTMINCVARDNTGSVSASFGINAGQNSTLMNCSVSDQAGSGSFSGGLEVGNNSTMMNCSVTDTTSTGTASASTGMGIYAGSGSSVTGCVAQNNRGDGISFVNNTFAKNNNSIANGVGTGSGAGIHATGADNRIEANNVIGNDRGIDVDAAGNLIVKNSASGNTTNYTIAAGNFFGAIVNVVVPAGSPTPPPVNGNSASSSITTTDPWANISY